MSHHTLCNVFIFALAFAVGYHIQGVHTHAAVPSTRSSLLVEVFTSCSPRSAVRAACPPDGVPGQLAEQQSVDIADVMAMPEDDSIRLLEYRLILRGQLCGRRPSARKPRLAADLIVSMATQHNLKL